MRYTVSTRWGSDIVCVSADWARAECQIEGLPGFQVADVAHETARAMRKALERAARDDGLDPDDPEVADKIAVAVAHRTEDIPDGAHHRYGDCQRIKPGDSIDPDNADNAPPQVTCAACRADLGLD